MGYLLFPTAETVDWKEKRKKWHAREVYGEQAAAGRYRDQTTEEKRWGFFRQHMLQRSGRETTVRCMLYLLSIMERDIRSWKPDKIQIAGKNVCTAGVFLLKRKGETDGTI